MAIWPASLPTLSASGYHLTPADQTVRSDMEIGTARVRRRTAARNDQVAGSCIMTDAQMATFRAWWDGTGADDAHGGTAWISQLPLSMGDGGLTTPDCRFIGPFSAVLLKPGNMLWSVSAKLEVR